MQPWLGEACDDGNTEAAITARPTAPKNSPGAATASSKTSAKSAMVSPTPIGAAAIVGFVWRKMPPSLQAVGS